MFNDEHFLPYAAGIIAAYALQNKKIAESYDLADIIYKCDDFEETLSAMEDASVVAFSNYMWNFEFNLRLAKGLKLRNPYCTVIFGGHQISDTSLWLEENPFIDFTVFGEGERIVSQILLAFCSDGNFSDIPNISYRCNNTIVTNSKQSICEDINSIPSPYLAGIFDSILKNSNDKFAAIIETSRGCPYHCAYCDWGDYDLPLRHFDVERVKKEIEYIAKNSVVFVVVTDSNFGIHPKDEIIADEFVRMKNKYGFPKAVEAASAKHNPERVFSINKKFFDNGMSRGATLSMQSLDPTTLKNIGRENITKEKFSDLIRLYSQNGIPAYTELILGLPGETYESFYEGIEYLLDNGQHNSIHVFFCEVLPNSVLGSEEYLKKHSINVLKRDFSLRNGMQSDGIQGQSQIIVSTETMNSEMFLKSIIYAFAVQTFHNFGLCRVIAMYFHYEKDIKYHVFYNAFIDWLLGSPESYSGKIFKDFTDRYRLSVTGNASDTYENPLFGKTQFNLSDGAFLELACSCDAFYNDLFDFLCTFSGDSTVLRELIRFQKMIIRKPDNREEYETFTYDWAGYYINLINNDNASPVKRDTDIKIFSSTEYTACDLISYAKAIAIKGRRTGKSIAMSDKNSYSINSDV